MKPTLLVSIFALISFTAILGSHSYEFKRADFCAISQESSNLTVVSHGPICVTTNPWISALNFVKSCVSWRRSSEKSAYRDQKTPINTSNTSLQNYEYDVYFDPLAYAQELTEYNDRKQKYTHTLEEPSPQKNVISALEDPDNQLKQRYEDYKNQSIVNAIE